MTQAPALNSFGGIHELQFEAEPKHAAHPALHGLHNPLLK